MADFNRGKYGVHQGTHIGRRTPARTRGPDDFQLARRSAANDLQRAQRNYGELARAAYENMRKINGVLEAFCRKYGVFTPVLLPDACMGLRIGLSAVNDRESIPFVVTALDCQQNIKGARHHLKDWMVGSMEDLFTMISEIDSSIESIVALRTNSGDGVCVTVGTATEELRQMNAEAGPRKRIAKTRRSKDDETIIERHRLSEESREAFLLFLADHEDAWLSSRNFERRVLDLIMRSSTSRTAVALGEKHSYAGKVVVSGHSTNVGPVVFRYLSDFADVSDGWLASQGCTDVMHIHLNLHAILGQSDSTESIRVSPRQYAQVDHSRAGLAYVEEMGLYPCAFEADLQKGVSLGLLTPDPELQTDLQKDILAEGCDIICAGLVIEVKTMRSPTFALTLPDHPLASDLPSAWRYQIRAARRRVDGWLGHLSIGTVFRLVIVSIHKTYTLDFEVGAMPEDWMDTRVSSMDVHIPGSTVLQPLNVVPRMYDANYFDNKLAMIKKDLTYHGKESWMGMSQRVYEMAFTPEWAERFRATALKQFEIKKKHAVRDTVKAFVEAYEAERRELVASKPEIMLKRPKASLMTFPLYNPIKNGEMVGLVETAEDMLTVRPGAHKTPHCIEYFGAALRACVESTDPDVKFFKNGSGHETACNMRSTNKRQNTLGGMSFSDDLTAGLLLELQQISTPPPTVTRESLTKFIRHHLPLLDSESGHQSSLHTVLNDTFWRLAGDDSTLYTICAMINTLLFLLRLEGMSLKRTTVPPGMVGLCNSPSGDKMAVVVSTTSVEARCMIYNRVASGEQAALISSWQNTLFGVDDSTGSSWKLEMLCNISIEKLVSSRIALSASLASIAIWVDLGPSVPMSTTSMSKRVLEGSSAKAVRLRNAFLLCLPLERGVNCEFVGVATALNMHSANSPYDGNLESFKKYAGLPPRRKLEMAILAWVFNCLEETSIHAAERLYMDPVSFDYGGNVYYTMSAMTNNRYAYSVTMGKNVTRRDWQTLEAVHSLAETQSLQTSSYQAAGGRRVFAEQHMHNGGLKEGYRTQALGWRSVKVTIGQVGVDTGSIEDFLECSLNPEVRNMCMPHMVADILHVAAVENSVKFLAAKETNSSIQSLDRMPQSTANTFSSAASPNPEYRHSGMRGKEMQELHERTNRMIGCSNSVTRESLGILLDELMTLHGRQDCLKNWWYRSWMLDIILAKIGQAGGNREISCCAQLKILMCEIFNNFGLCLQVPGDAATWGEKSKSNLLQMTQDFTQTLRHSGVIFCSSVTQHKPSPYPIPPGQLLRPFSANTCMDISKFAPTMSVAMLCSIIFALEFLLEPDETVAALMGALSHAGRNSMVPEEVVKFCHENAGRDTKHGEMADRILKYLNRGERLFEMSGKLGIGTALGGKVEGNANAVASAALTALEADITGRVCDYIKEKLVPADAKILVRTAEGVVEIAWSDCPPSVKAACCRSSTAWCADDGIRMFCLPDACFMPLFNGYVSCLLQMCGFVTNAAKSITTWFGGEFTGFNVQMYPQARITEPLVKAVRGACIFPPSVMGGYRTLMSVGQSMFAKQSGLLAPNFTVAVGGVVARAKYGVFANKLATSGERTATLLDLPPLLFGPTVIEPGVVASIYQPVEQWCAWALRVNDVRTPAMRGLLLLKAFMRDGTYLHHGGMAADTSEELGFLDPAHLVYATTGKVRRALSGIDIGIACVLGGLQNSNVLVDPTSVPHHTRAHRALCGHPSGSLSAEINLKTLFASLSKGYRLAGKPGSGFSMGTLMAMIANAEIDPADPTVYHVNVIIEEEPWHFKIVLPTIDQIMVACRTTVKSTYVNLGRAEYLQRLIGEEVDGTTACVRVGSAVYRHGNIAHMALVLADNVNELALAVASHYTKEFARRTIEITSKLFLDSADVASFSLKRLENLNRMLNPMSTVMLPFEPLGTVRSIMQMQAEMVTMRERWEVAPLMSEEEDASLKIVEERIMALQSGCSDILSCMSYLRPDVVRMLADSLAEAVARDLGDVATAGGVLMEYAGVKAAHLNAAASYIFRLTTQLPRSTHFSASLPGVKTLIMQPSGLEVAYDLLYHSAGVSEEEIAIIIISRSEESRAAEQVAAAAKAGRPLGDQELEVDAACMASIHLLYDRLPTSSRFSRIISGVLPYVLALNARVLAARVVELEGKISLSQHALPPDMPLDRIVRFADCSIAGTRVSNRVMAALRPSQRGGLSITTHTDHEMPVSPGQVVRKPMRSNIMPGVSFVSAGAAAAAPVAQMPQPARVAAPFALDVPRIQDPDDDLLGEDTGMVASKKDQVRDYILTKRVRTGKKGRLGYLEEQSWGICVDGWRLAEADDFDLGRRTVKLLGEDWVCTHAPSNSVTNMLTVNGCRLFFGYRSPNRPMSDALNAQIIHNESGPGAHFSWLTIQRFNRIAGAGKLVKYQSRASIYDAVRLEVDGNPCMSTKKVPLSSDELIECLEELEEHDYSEPFVTHLDVLSDMILIDVEAYDLEHGVEDLAVGEEVADGALEERGD